MEKIDIAIIGGGASGLFLANALEVKENIVIFERGERVGRKLSATGNGQGNITHLDADQTEYFSSESSSLTRAQKCIQAYNQNALMAFFQSLGVLLQADDRGRVYPAGRQASSLTDALRFALAERGIRVELSSKVTEIKRTKEGFLLTVEKANDGGRVAFTAKKVVLCGGGKAAKNFGTDGGCYELAKSLGHTCTALYPSLVQLKTDTMYTKTLKGIRVNDGGLTARFGNGKTISLQGDIIFTDYGVSGDAVFRISAFITDQIEGGKVELSIDFLPNVVEDEVLTLLEQKRRAFPAMAEGELLLGILNNQVGRAVMKRAGNDLRRAAKLVKAFPLTVTGSLGFDYAQVTKGGIPMSEVDDHLQSKIVPNLYFAGEILDIDGPCGGFNLQWAFSS
ncbi:MAG: aminoacetone oxidase family FAD-binding enzyme, partial [Clostridia bacterium]|nr:aminoacetone oxidase family FAD-binding enzyme [Clostridia bacterium]